MISMLSALNVGMNLGGVCVCVCVCVCVGPDRLCSATFEQLLAFGATFSKFSNFEQLLVFWAAFEQIVLIYLIRITKINLWSNFWKGHIYLCKNIDALYTLAYSWGYFWLTALPGGLVATRQGFPGLVAQRALPQISLQINLLNFLIFQLTKRSNNWSYLRIFVWNMVY